jgi:hypothetical protein
MRKRISAVFAVLAAASLACSAAQQLAGGGGGGTSPSSAASSKVLFQDDFSDSSSGWPEASDSDKAAGYTGDGRYSIQAITEKQDVWAHPGQDFSDVSIEVDAVKSGGPDNNDFGVICRFVDDGNFYFFLLASDGFQVIGKYENGEAVFLSAEKMQPSDEVNQGTESNHLRADCNGNTLTLFANGTQVAQVTDTSFSHGDVGLTAGTFDDPNVSIVFDNFVVREP